MPTLRSKKSRTAFYVLMMPLILTACGTARFDTAQSTKLILPPVILYTPALQSAAADEAESGVCTAHVELGKDYKLTRDRLRIAKGALGK